MVPKSFGTLINVNIGVKEGLEERLRRNRMRIERILEEENSIPLIRKLKDAKNILVMETENMQINSGQEQVIFNPLDKYELTL